MKNELLVSMASLGMLLILPSCATGFSSAASSQSLQLQEGEAIPITAANENPSSHQVMRRKDIPLLQIDALSVYQRMINYYTPEGEATPAVISEQLTAYIDFPAGGVSVNARYGNNQAELEKLKQQLSTLLRAGNKQVKNIRLTGFASPDGDTKENERLAGNRVIQFKSYLMKELKLTSSLITIDWAGEDWEGLCRLVSASGKEYTKNVLAAINGTKDPEKRRNLLKALNGGATYKDIEKTLFSRLRRMQLIVDCESQFEEKSNKKLMELFYSNPDQLSLEDMFRVAGFYRPGTEQYREVFEIAAYTYPSNAIAQLNAAAAALALGDKEDAHYFLQQVDGDPRSYNNLGVLALMEGDTETAIIYFRKAMSQNPRLSRENLKIVNQ